MCSAYCFLKFDRTQNHVCQWLRQTPVIMLALLPILSKCYKFKGLHLLAIFVFTFPFCSLLLLKGAFNQHFPFFTFWYFSFGKALLFFCAIYWPYSVLLFSPAGVCFWLCIACHEIWATQNVSTYIVTAYGLCSLYAGGWVPEQWLTVSLYTAPPCVRISEHIWEVSGNCSLKIQIQLPAFQTQIHFSESQSRLTFLNLNPDSETCVACA